MLRHEPSISSLDTTGHAGRHGALSGQTGTCPLVGERVQGRVHHARSCASVCVSPVTTCHLMKPRRTLN
eukprot:6974991-Prymnesium_polylepis.1